MNRICRYCGRWYDFSKLVLLIVQVAMFEWQPSTLYYRNEEGDLAFLYGRDVEVIRALASVFNFSAKFVETTNG